MLSLVDENLSRRSFLRIGSLGLGGLTLPRLLAAEGSVARGHPSFVTDKSVMPFRDSSCRAGFFGDSRSKSAAFAGLSHWHFPAGRLQYQRRYLP